jgi:prephenate dehydratase
MKEAQNSKLKAQISVLRVAFQGERGAFSEEAIAKLLGEAAIAVPCPTFESLFRAVDEGRAERILAPLENSLAGSVHRCYDLLLETSLLIEAEVVLPVAHCLIGCAGARLEDIRVVESHPVALAQCQRFLAAHPQIEYRAANDTAASARRIVEKGDKSVAAIAASRAAKLHGGQVLRRNLQDHAENYTRFVLLSPAPRIAPDADKVSLAFKLKHEPGSLYRAIGAFATRGLDLLKIESRPVIGAPFQYRFYLDARASVSQTEFSAALNELENSAEDVRLLGCYRAAARYSQDNAKEIISWHEKTA